MLRRNRRIVAGVLLGLSGLGFAVAFAFYIHDEGWRALDRIAVPAIALAAIVAAANLARLWRMRKPKPRPLKPPSYLRVVRDKDETLH